MKSLERVLKSLEHKEPDRIPFDLGSTLVTGITKNAYINLASRLGKRLEGIELYDVIQQLPVIEESVLKRLEVDVRGLIPNFVRKNPPIEEKRDFYSFVDEWNITWKMPKGSLYFDIAETPLPGEINEQDIDNFPWPNPKDPAILEGLKEKAKRLNQQEYPVILESLCAGIFEMSCRMRGTEQFLIDLAVNTRLASKLLDKFVELKIEFYRSASEKFGEYIQFIREGDDIAGQEAPLISSKMYREFIKPRHKELFEAQKSFFPAPFYVFFHSDGAIYDLIPDFIEIGIDILNPVQATARGMNLRRLKKEFGKDITFWGGGVDTQNVLPIGSLEEIEKNVSENIRDLAPKGGFIFGAVHNIQDDVSAENILTMLKKFKELENY